MVGCSEAGSFAHVEYEWLTVEVGVTGRSDDDDDVRNVVPRVDGLGTLTRHCACFDGSQTSACLRQREHCGLA